MSRYTPSPVPPPSQYDYDYGPPPQALNFSYSRMQTIKCVVVGDGAVGKVSVRIAPDSCFLRLTHRRSFVVLRRVSSSAIPQMPFQ